MIPKSALLSKCGECWVDVELTATYILNTQKHTGEIPWSAGGKTDPWDHVECAMGLSVAGCHQAAKKAYDWSLSAQNPDGSWWSEYQKGVPLEDAHKDANMTAYIAVGAYHYFLATGDLDFLGYLWPTVKKAIDFTVCLQGDAGEIYWAQRKNGSISRRALLTGSSSIYKSLSCAIDIAKILEKPQPHWVVAHQKLGSAILQQPHLFDQSKTVFAMDWYYPVLSGAITGLDAIKRIKNSWQEFVMDGWGVRCVSDEAWLTMAETSELVVALAGIGDHVTAETVFEWMQDKKYDDGAFWTGVTFPDRIVYTNEKTTWTGAAILLAADILYDLSSASGLFRHNKKR
jgi:MMP endo-(1,4)-3-O-methyl-alpha-D-mannosidase